MVVLSAKNSVTRKIFRQEGVVSQRQRVMELPVIKVGWPK